VNFQKSVCFLTIGLLATEIVSLTTKPSYAGSVPTTFQCVRHSGGENAAKFATIAAKATGERTDPILLWKSTYFVQDGYTPERRCYAVTNNLNKAVSMNGGKLGNLFLTGGPVYGKKDPVICYVNQSSGGCNSSNILFTVSGQNRNKIKEILTSLMNFGITGSGSAIQESEGQPYVNLGELVDNAFGSTTSSSINIPGTDGTSSVRNTPSISPEGLSPSTNGGGI
jgi:hypothetical protein